MRPRKYRVELTKTEREKLEEINSKGKSAAKKIKHAHILLKLDESEGRKAFDVHERTVCQIAKRFVEEGLESALERKKQLNRHHKITGDVEAQMIAIACSGAPEGYSRWTL